MAKSAASILQKWITNSTQAANAAYKDGVMSVTEAPSHAAARQVNKYLQKVQEAVSSGKFVNKCMKATLQDYQQGVLNKGVTAYSAGINAAKVKMDRHIQRSMPFWAQLKEECRAMPNNDLTQGIEKVRRAAQANIDFYAGG